jgi:hypothetical protein
MKIDIDYIKRTRRFRFRFIDVLNGLFLILPIVLILLSTVMIRSNYLNDMSGFNGLFNAALIIGLLGITILLFTIKRLIQNIRFKRVDTGKDLKTNIEIAKKVFLELYEKQFIDNKSSDLGMITSNSNISGLSWGEINTVICCDKYILINSRPTWQPVTIFENKLNLNKIIQKVNEEIKPSSQQRV